MISCQRFEHIDGGGNCLAFSVLHRLGQIELVEKHIPKLAGRIDIEVASSLFVNFARFDFNLVLQPRRHLRKRLAIYLHSRLLYARQYRNQR